MGVVPALVAEGSLVDLLEGALRQLSITVGASEVFGMEFLPQGSHTTTGDGHSTGGAEGASLLVVVSLTQGLAPCIEERPSLEGTTASLADEAVGMPLSAQSSDEVVLDGGLAPMALGGEETEEVLTTVGTTILLMESVVSEFP